MPERNVEMLKKVRNHIATFPDQHHQMDWVVLRGEISSCGRQPAEFRKQVHPEGERYACVSAACLAGWTALLADEDPPDGEGWIDLTARLLGLTYEEADTITDPHWSTEEILQMLDGLIGHGELFDTPESRRCLSATSSC